EGPLEEELRSLVETLKIGDRVSFSGSVPHQSLPACYEQADILLHTSMSEGHPIVVEEAMSSGVLVCGTRVGLLFDLPECCVSVPVGDYRLLADETLKLIKDPMRMRKMKENAYEWASSHSIDWTTTRLREIYDSNDENT